MYCVIIDRSVYSCMINKKNKKKTKYLIRTLFTQWEPSKYLVIDVLQGPKSLCIPLDLVPGNLVGD